MDLQEVRLKNTSRRTIFSTLILNLVMSDSNTCSTLKISKIFILDKSSSKAYIKFLFISVVAANPNLANSTKCNLKKARQS